jgi:hypothetical protein
MKIQVLTRDKCAQANGPTRDILDLMMVLREAGVLKMTAVMGAETGSVCWALSFAYN